MDTSQTNVMPSESSAQFSRQLLLEDHDKEVLYLWGIIFALSRMNRGGHEWEGEMPARICSWLLDLTCKISILR
jgi:hypothetical protein